VSHRAVGVALASADSTVRELASTLYFYNRLPPPPGWGHRLPDATAVAQFLGLGDKCRLPGAYSVKWSPTSITTSAGESSPWWIWRPQRQRIEVSRVKVYISPHPSQLPLVLPNVTRELYSSRAVGLKIAADAANLLRPDKLMVYFSRVDAANRFARKIAHAVAGVQAQATPFTKPIDVDGLVSLGFDPPAAPNGANRLPPSWRAFATGRVGRAIVDTRRAARRQGVEPTVADVLEKVRSDGIDPDSWTPTSPIWTP
jgi:hypothetical protein